MKTIACRCEDVTLHDLEDAIARGHRDIESLKRYTGFGTGWCQGKGCVALCARVVTRRSERARACESKIERVGLLNLKTKIVSKKKACI